MQKWLPGRRLLSHEDGIAGTSPYLEELDQTSKLQQTGTVLKKLYKPKTTFKTENVDPE